MFSDSYASQINVRPSLSRPGPASLPGVEERYRKAKARLAAAQQEKMEAAAEFLAARAALSRRLEEVWPGPSGPAGEDANGLQAKRV